MAPKMARLTRLVRSVSGRNVVNAIVIESTEGAPPAPLEKVDEPTPADGGGEPPAAAPAEEEAKPEEADAPPEAEPEAPEKEKKDKKKKKKKDKEAESSSSDSPEEAPPARVVSMQYPYGMYVGQTVPDERLMCQIPHGRGKFFYNDGAMYVGEWDHGNWEGEAVRIWPLGARYEGEFKNNLQHGQGTLLLPRGGGGYSGEWENGYQHGQGILTTPDGQTCEGDFVNGNPHGKGVMKTPHGMQYEGDFSNGLPHGKGVTTYPDGTKYEGDFQEGAMHGEGVMFDAEGEEIRKGAWENDEEVEETA